MGARINFDMNYLAKIPGVAKSLWYLTEEEQFILRDQPR